MRLFLRFFLLLVFFGLAPLSLAFLWFSNSQAVVRENAKSFHSQLARVAAESAEESAREMNLSLAFVSELEGGADWSARSVAVQRGVALHPDILMVSLADPAGGRRLHLAASSLFPDPAGDPLWDGLLRRARETGKVAVGPAGLKGDRPYAALAYPLTDGSSLLVAYGLDRLWRRLRGLRVGATGRIILADPEGRPLPAMDDGILEPAWVFLEPAEGPQGWSPSLPSTKGALVGAWAAVPSMRWTALSLQRREEAFANGDRVTAEAAGLLLGVFALVSGAAFWIAGRISGPLQSLSLIAARVSKEEFSGQVPETGWAEFRGVQRAFNGMMKSLRAYQGMQVDRQLDEKAKLDALVRAVPSGIVLAGEDGQVLYVNSAARGILGESGATMPSGTSMDQVLREPKLAALTKDVLSNSKGTQICQLELSFRGEKRPRIFLCQGKRVRREERVLGVMILLTDVTAERDLERMKETFLHGVVHDLRGPLGTVSGWIEAMEAKGTIPDSGKRGLSFVKTGIQQMAQLVDNILDTARMTAGGLKPNLEPTLPADLLEEARTLFAIQAEVRKVDLLVAPSSAGARSVVCDRKLLLRALANFVMNALKFTPAGGKVTLEARASADAVEFRVSDTGCGMPKDQLDKLFRPFSQLSAGVAAGGYGLGLSVSKWFVELHGGRVHVESQEAMGTTIAFIIPAAPKA